MIIGQFVMVLQAVESVRYGARHAADHRANQIMFLERREIIHGEQLDGLKANLFPRGTEIVQADFWVTPFADRMVDSAFEFRSGRGLGSGQSL